MQLTRVCIQHLVESVHVLKDVDHSDQLTEPSNTETRSDYQTRKRFVLETKKKKLELKKGYDPLYGQIFIPFLD